MSDPTKAESALELAIETVEVAITMINRGITGQRVSKDELEAAQYIVEHFIPLIAELRQLRR